MFGQQLEIEMKTTKMTNQGTERYSRLNFKNQNWNEFNNEQRKKKTWSRTWTSTTWNGNGNNKGIETDTCERKQKRDNRCILGFSLLVFKLSNDDSKIPMFICWHIQFQFSKLSLLDFRFHSFRSLSFLIAELGFPNFDLHTIDTFKLRVPCVFSFCWLSRLSDFNILVFWCSSFLFQISDYR